MTVKNFELAPAQSGAEPVAAELQTMHQKQLFNRAVNGDQLARESLIEGYSPLAAKLAKKYARGPEPLEDLEQVASLALIKSIDNFDLDRGVAFPSYAVPCILGAIKKHFRENTSLIHLPRAIADSAGLVNRAIDRLEADQKKISPENVAEELGVSAKEAREYLMARAASRNILSLSASPFSTLNGSKDINSTLADTVVDTDWETEYNLCAQKTDIEYAISKLPQELEFVIRGKLTGQTQEQIGAKLGVSQMQVSRLMRRAFERMAPFLEEYSEQEAA